MAEFQVRRWPQTVFLPPHLRARSGLLQGGDADRNRQDGRTPLLCGGIWYGLWKIMECCLS